MLHKTKAMVVSVASTLWLWNCVVGKALWWTSGAIALRTADKMASDPRRGTSVNGGRLLVFIIVACAFMHLSQRWQHHQRLICSRQTRNVVKFVQEVHEKGKEDDLEDRQTKSEHEAGDFTERMEFHLSSSVQQGARQLGDLSDAGSEVGSSSSCLLLEGAGLNSAVDHLERPDAPREMNKDSMVTPLLVPVASTVPCTQRPPLGVSGSGAASAKRLLPLSQAPACTDLAPASAAPCNHQRNGGAACSSASLPAGLLPLSKAWQPAQLAQSGTMRRAVTDEACRSPQCDMGSPKAKGRVRAITMQLEQRCVAQNNAEGAHCRIPNELHLPHGGVVGRPTLSASWAKQRSF